MKILSIGNSFSADAQRWLHEISSYDELNIDTYNLFIGGCSLEKHCECIVNGKQEYEFQGNNIEKIKASSILDAVLGTDYDIITIQQASGFSGRPQTYFPFLYLLIDFIHSYQPKAKIYFHQTWSYEIDSSHQHFYFYNNDQNEMYRRIVDCSKMVNTVAKIPVIPVGEFIQFLRNNTKEFDYQNQGLSLCRDGFHLSETYGRFAASAVWYKEITGQYVNINGFIENNKDFNKEILDVIIKNLYKFYLERE